MMPWRYSINPVEVFHVSIQQKVCCLCRVPSIRSTDMTLPLQDPTSYSILSTAHECTTAIANLSYPWADHRNDVLSRTAGENVSEHKKWDGRAHYFGSFVKRQWWHGTERISTKDTYPYVYGPLCDHSSRNISDLSPPTVTM